MKKISVVVPVYKVEEFLPYCVESIVNQTYKNLEIVLVDDGSPDSCGKICDEWAQKDARIKVIHKENGGVSSARNVALDVITGEYLFFADADDTIHPKMCEYLVKVLEQNDADISACSWRKVYNIACPENAEYNIDKTSVDTYEGEEVFDLLFNKKVPLIMAVWSKLYKSEVYKNIRYPEGRVHEDDAVAHKVLHNCKKLCYVDLPLYNNTQRNGSITSTGFSKKRLIVLDTLKERIEFVKTNQPKFVDKVIKHDMRISILYYYYAKWAHIDKEILQSIRQEVLCYYNNGYKSKVAFAFRFFPNTLSLILKIRERML